MGERTHKYAVIFDLDGVLSNTQQTHAIAESEVLKSYGIEIPHADISARFAGAGERVMFKALFDEHQIASPAIETLLSEKWKSMDRLMQKGIEAIPHAVSLVRNLKAAGFVLAVASGSSREFIARVLSALDISDCFETFVSGEEVPSGKPAPDVFLEAARRLGVPPSRCLVIEDGLPGMKAAQAASMPCIALVPDLSISCPATFKVTSFETLTVETIGRLVAERSGTFRP